MLPTNHFRKRIRRWLTAHVDPTTYFLLRHPNRYTEIGRLSKGVRDASPHPRLFFMVVMPGCLHIAQLAYQFVPADVRLIVVLNGTDQWEEDWAHANLSRAIIIRIKSKYFHHTLLNLFLRDVHQPFGIVDFDCFVFCPDYFRVVEAIGPSTTCQAFYASHNPVLDLWIPETFLMVLNQPVLADLMARYHVSTDQISWSDLPTPIQQRLATLGIGVDQLPENYKPTFDTLRVLLMLGVTEGCQIEFITKRGAALHIADDLFHVGQAPTLAENSMQHFRMTFGGAISGFVVSNRSMMPRCVNVISASSASAVRRRFSAIYEVVRTKNSLSTSTR